MSTIITRAGKGSPLTHNEVDANFDNLNTDKAEVGSANTFTAAQTISNQLNLTNASNYNLYASGAGDNYMEGKLGIGITSPTAKLHVTNTGAGNSFLVEDSANPDLSPFVIDALGLAVMGHTVNLTSYQLQIVSANPLDMMRWNNAAPGPTSRFAKSRSATVGTYSIVGSADTLGTLAFAGDDGTQFVIAASIAGSVDGTPGLNDMPGKLVFSTTADGASTATERMRIDSVGRVGIGGSSYAGNSLAVLKNITGAAATYVVSSEGTIQSDVTSARLFNTAARTAAASFTVANLYHYNAEQGTFGAGSAVTTQAGFFSQTVLTGATNNYSFQGALAAATGRYNLYMSGTADNYLAGSLGIGVLPNAAITLYVNKNITGATTSYGIANTGTIQSDVTSLAYGVYSGVSTAAAAFTLTTLRQFAVNGATIGAGSAVTTQAGFHVASTLTTATNNYGFQGDLAAATGRYNLYMGGTAVNYLAGSLGIGAVPSAGQTLYLAKTITGNVNSTSVRSQGVVQSDVTTSVFAFDNVLVTAASAFTLTTYNHYTAQQSTIGAGSAVTTQAGFVGAASLSGATNNYVFRGQLAAATGRWNLYMNGTANNYLAGTLGIGQTYGYNSSKLVIFGQSGGADGAYATGEGSIVLNEGGRTAITNIGGLEFKTSVFGSGYGAKILALDAGELLFGNRANSSTWIERMRIDNAGNVLVTGTGGLGYGTGSGGAVTQITSRTTGVTLNKTNGAITLVSAAGSITYQSFTVTNSTVAATDTIIVNQKSGTDKYIILVTTVAAGSFQITFATTSGVTTEQPVFNFAVIKAVAA